ncbi:hypothetical protein RF11_05875 [Thelohanellus kitauei]|uniref:Uncharacterized protein n=1 Tax=Thelohanellus kitauei TaxID=669202 RepID=A0A0C2IEW0_THEKT|nr:hypothetical protein RF11_05875 [Thelohanellus kitauei]
MSRIFTYFRLYLTPQVTMDIATPVVSSITLPVQNSTSVESNESLKRFIGVKEQLEKEMEALLIKMADEYFLLLTRITEIKNKYIKQVGLAFEKSMAALNVDGQIEPTVKDNPVTKIIPSTDKYVSQIKTAKKIPPVQIITLVGDKSSDVQEKEHKVTEAVALVSSRDLFMKTLKKHCTLTQSNTA